MLRIHKLIYKVEETTPQITENKYWRMIKYLLCMTPKYWTMLIFDMTTDEIKAILKGDVKNYEQEAKRQEHTPV